MKKLTTLLLLFLLPLWGMGGFAQEKLTKEEKARREKNIQAGNPFARFGYKAKIATLSKGKYLEFHDLDSIVVIGTVRWHVNKNEIVGRIVQDSLNPDAQPIGDRAGRWISPDPLSEEFPSWSPYNMCMDNPLRMVDPDGKAPDDIVFRGKDNKELRIKTAGEDKVINLPFNIGTNKTLDLGISNIDPNRFIVGYSAQADLNAGAIVAAQWGAEVDVANFTDKKYSGYNYVYGGGHVNRTIGGQVSFSGSVGGSVFFGYNDSKDIIDPTSFSGYTYTTNVSADLKAIVGGGFNIGAFSSVENPITEKGWKGFTIGIGVGVGAGANVGALGYQTSLTHLLNDVKPTSQRSFSDILSNTIAPITSSLIQATANQINK